MSRLLNATPAVACFLYACWAHRQHTGDWMFAMLASIYLLLFALYTDLGRKG